MKVIGIELQNIKSFVVLPKTEFSKKINVFIGENNSGKSTILNSIHLLQKRDALTKSDLSVGETDGSVRLFTSGHSDRNIAYDPSRLGIIFHIPSGQRNFFHENNNVSGWGGATGQSEPDNLIYPYLSKRKVITYSSDVHKAATNAILGNFTHLYAKIDRLSDPEGTWYKDYVSACDNILGFRISSSGDIGNGKRAVYKLEGFDEIPLTSMGEGVANLLGLIVDLCVAKERIFIIEEPENDIHPKALKALLDLIIKKSDTNQFFISTHSNIVMQTLGGIFDSKVFEVSSKRGKVNNPKMFVSSIRELSSVGDRLDALEKLGYDFFDYGQYAGYLFLEESTAERVIREFLIPEFVPGLVNKIRTYSSGGVGKISDRFEKFNSLFTFIHLEPIYKNKAWVVVDHGDQENEILDKLRELYVKRNGWNEENFSQFEKHDFEEYYPVNFKKKFEDEIKNNNLSEKEKREKKKYLFEDLLSWISLNKEEAKIQFEISSKEIIDKLKSIEASLS